MSTASRHLNQWLTIFAILSLTLTALAMPPELSGRTAASRPTIVRREMTPYSSCSGSEGQWNCMTDSFQRCGSGQWSVTQQCAGTQCSPSGLTYEFHVDFANGYNGAAPPTSSASPAAGTGVKGVATGGLVSWWLMCILGTGAVLLWI
ncbi:hypothetical protein GGR57DRAFT_414974 [Xylariaceae sp. FL1272]|nr:hypothetical protein GGR57DRAFT_414974 [Xylariaceae sp. FL1272]